MVTRIDDLTVDPMAVRNPETLAQGSQQSLEEQQREILELEGVSDEDRQVMLTRLELHYQSQGQLRPEGDDMAIGDMNRGLATIYGANDGRIVTVLLRHRQRLLSLRDPETGKSYFVLNHPPGLDPILGEYPCFLNSTHPFWTARGFDKLTREECRKQHLLTEQSRIEHMETFHTRVWTTMKASDPRLAQIATLMPDGTTKEPYDRHGEPVVDIDSEVAKRVQLAKDEAEINRRVKAELVALGLEEPEPEDAAVKAKVDAEVARLTAPPPAADPPADAPPADAPPAADPSADAPPADDPPAADQTPSAAELDENGRCSVCDQDFNLDKDGTQRELKAAENAFRAHARAKHPAS